MENNLYIVFVNYICIYVGPDTCGLTIVATMQHETLGTHIHVKRLVPNVFTYTLMCHIIMIHYFYLP